LTQITQLVGTLDSLHPGTSIPWGNEAEIFIKAILGENNLFAILGGIYFLPFEGGKEI